MVHESQDDTLHRRGLMFILSSPSGAGKTTIARMLLAHDDEIAMSVSATTRPIRPGEVEGKDYFFVDDAEFERMVEAGEFYEWATVFGNRYGTPKAHIRNRLKAGGDVLFDIDWQGTQQLHQKAQADVVRVFILPPSLEELGRRLTGRGTDAPEVIDARMARAQAASKPRDSSPSCSAATTSGPSAASASSTSSSRGASTTRTSATCTASRRRACRKTSSRAPACRRGTLHQASRSSPCWSASSSASSSPVVTGTRPVSGSPRGAVMPVTYPGRGDACIRATRVRPGQRRTTRGVVPVDTDRWPVGPDSRSPGPTGCLSCQAVSSGSSTVTTEAR